MAAPWSLMGAEAATALAPRICKGMKRLDGLARGDCALQTAKRMKSLSLIRMADHPPEIDSSKENQPDIVHVEWKLDVDDYHTFVTEFRERLANHQEHESDIKIRWDWIKHHPLLPKEKPDKPTRWMYIKLSLASGESTTLVIRDDNVYLIGFMNQNGDIYEFGENPNGDVGKRPKDGRNKKPKDGRKKPKDASEKSVAIIGGSTFLGYDYRYESLLGVHVSEEFMDRNSIDSAVKSLAKHGSNEKGTPPHNNRLKCHLARLMLMVCEPARMYPHLKEADRGWKDKKDSKIRFDKQLFKYVRNWTKMSRAVITNKWRDFASLKEIEILDRKCAFKIVHLIKYYSLTTDEEAGDNEPVEEQPEQPAPQQDHRPGQPPAGQPGAGGGGAQHPEQQPPQSPAPAPQQQQQGQQRQHTTHHSDDGCPMMEVFSLRAKNRVSGTIAIFDGKRGQVIYEDDGDADAPTKDRQGNLVLTGPYRAISADGRVAMKHYAAPGCNDAVSDQFTKVTRSDMLWDPYARNNLEFQYDKLLTKSITEDLQMSYAVLSSAEEATVQVDVLPSRDDTGVYGEITAHTKLPNGEDVSIVLFRSEEEEPLELVKTFAGSTIPLDRSVLAWGFDSPIVIKVGLQATSPIHEGTSTSTYAAPFQGMDFIFDDHEDKFHLVPLEGIGYVRVSINVTGEHWVPGLRKNMMDPAMCAETDYLLVHPPQLRFTFEPDKLMPCLLHITNDTDDEHVAFRLRPAKESAAAYFHRITEVCGILPPNTTSTYLVRLERQPEKRPWGSMDELDIILESCVAAAPKGVEDVDSSFRSQTRASEEIDACFQLASDEIEKVTLKVNVCDPADKTTTSEPIRQGIKITSNDLIGPIDMHPTEPWILARYFNGSICIWNYETMAEAMPLARLQDINQNPTRPSSLKFIAREQWFIAGDWHGYIHVYTWDDTAMKEVRKFKAHEKGRVGSLAVHPNEPHVLSSSWGEDLIKLWKWEADRDWKCIRTFDYSIRSHKGIFNPFDGNAFATLSAWRALQMWNISRPHPVATLDCPRDEGILLGFDYFSTGGTGGGDQLFMVTGSSNGIGRIWDLKNNRCITKVEGLQRPTEWRSLAVNVAVVHKSHVGRPILLTVSRDHVISLYDCITYRCQRTIDLKLGEVQDILYAKSTGSLVIQCVEGLAVMDLDEFSFSSEKPDLAAMKIPGLTTMSVGEMKV